MNRKMLGSFPSLHEVLSRAVEAAGRTVRVVLLLITGHPIRCFSHCISRTSAIDLMPNPLSRPSVTRSRES